MDQEWEALKTVAKQGDFWYNTETIMARKDTKQIVIYQAPSGAIELRGDFERETIWATQAEIASVFGVTPQNITMHLRNIYRQKELKEQVTCKESLQVQIEGGRKVERRIKEYNLDAIIAVGYRINSIIGTRFRQWATKTLQEHITRGYTINRKRIAENYDVFMKSVSDIQALLPKHITLDPKAILDLVKEFSSTWMSLDAYDKDALAFPPPPNFVFRFAKYAAKEDVALAPSLPCAGNAEGLPFWLPNFNIFDTITLSKLIYT